MQILPGVRAPVVNADIEWKDGEPFSRDFQDIYFSRNAGREETEHVFLNGNDLPERWKTHTGSFFAVGELGFGTGLNFLITAQSFREHAPAHMRLLYFSVESRPLSAEDLARSHAAFPDLAEDARALRRAFPPLLPGFHQIKFYGGRVTLVLLLGDALDMLDRLSGPFHAWFLDGFAPGKNPEIWSADVMRRLARVSAHQATASTYSESSVVLEALTLAGFAAEKAPGFGRKKAMTRARLMSGGMPPPAVIDSASVVGAGFAGASAARSLAERGIAVRCQSAHDLPPSSHVPVSVYMPMPTVHPTAMSRWTAQGCLAVSRRIASLQVPEVRGIFESAPDVDAAWLKNELMWPHDFARVIDAAESRQRTGIDAGRGILFEAAGTIESRLYCERLLHHPLVEMIEGRLASIKASPGRSVILAGGSGGQPLIDRLGIGMGLLYGRQFVIENDSLPGNAPVRALSIPLVDGLIANPLRGRLTVGSSFERGDLHPDETIIEETWNRTGSVLRPLLPWNVMQRARESFRGARLCARDNAPIIGPAPDNANDWDAVSETRQPSTFVISALGARGLIFSALAGEVVAAMAAGEPLPLETDLVNALLPGRFHAREQRRLGKQKGGGKKA